MNYWIPALIGAVLLVYTGYKLLKKHEADGTAGGYPYGIGAFDVFLMLIGAILTIVSAAHFIFE